MYTLIFLVVIALAVFFIYRGVTQKRNMLIGTGIVLAIFTFLFMCFMGFWGDKLWFDELGYDSRFWTIWLTRLLLFIGMFLSGGLLVYLLTWKIPRDVPFIRLLAALLGGVISAIYWSGNWEIVLTYFNRVATGLSDPVIGQDAGFYLFSYPFFNILFGGLLIVVVIPILTHIFLSRYLDMQRMRGASMSLSGLHVGSLYTLAGILLLVLAFGRFMARYGILFSDYGIVSGPGWTDVNIRLPMLSVMTIIAALGGIILILAGSSRSLRARLSLKSIRSDFSALITVAGTVAAAWILLLGALPVLTQSLKVEPNEITLEKPYIEHNIKFTQHGFNLDKVEKQEYDVTDQFSQEAVEENRNLFSNIRLWDYRALDAVFKQFQEIRLYYEFRDVDIDRYTIDSAYRQVMVSAREMQSGNLPLQSQTFVNSHFKYTHGYGAALNLVNEFTDEGLPNLLIRDIPPVSSYPNLEINRPEIYYGELTRSYVVVNSSEQEFDYPSGETNMYSTYGGSGGVPVSNVFRKFLYGYKYGGTRFLL